MTAPSYMARRIAAWWKELTADDLVWLRRQINEPPPRAGVREPRRPKPPLDARGIELDAPTGKTDPE